MIILNEKEYAEDCLRNKVIIGKPFYTLSVLAKYYYHVTGYRKKKIEVALTEFMSKYYPMYNADRLRWDDTIEKIASNAGKYVLCEIDGIWITQAELDTINNIHNKVLERLAFAMLCLAKLNNAKNPKNNGWVSQTAKEIFKLARISCSVTDRYERLSQLYQLSLLELPKRNDNLNCRVTYINDDSEKVLFISDFRELGYEYLKYKGEQFIRCSECGILIRNNKAGTKRYCKECNGYLRKRFKTIVCVDCGTEIEISAKNNRTCRCRECQTIRDREKSQIRVQKFRANQSM